MQFITVAAFFAATALAIPADNIIVVPRVAVPAPAPASAAMGSASGVACENTAVSTPACCGANLLGFLGLNCDSPTKPLTDGPSLITHCASKGMQGLCCGPSILGLGLLCGSPIGISG